MTKNSNKVYIKHQHKVMIFIGLGIVLFSYGWETHLGVIFGSLIMGVGIARIKD